MTFNVDLRRVSHKLWMMLGEAQSKCEHLAGVPLPPDHQSDFHALYLAKGVHATTAIEGNTLTENQVRQRIEGQLELPPSQEYMGKEIDNISKGCNKILSQLNKKGATPLEVDEIKRFNAMVLEGLELDDGIVPGEIRKIMVGVARYRAVPPEHCLKLLQEMCNWLNNDSFKQPDHRIAFGILQAILAHLYIAWIHPFGDGNGRTARLVEFKILLSHSVPSDAAHLLSNHYNQTRTEYYRQLDRASKSNGDVIPFIEYAISGFIDGLKEQLSSVRTLQLKITWRDHVYNSFRNKSGAANDRKRKLALDISEQVAPVLPRNIRLLTPRLAELYANKTYRAIVRDIETLIQMKLLVRTPKGYQANWELMKGFLPICIPPLPSGANEQQECVVAEETA